MLWPVAVRGAYGLSLPGALSPHPALREVRSPAGILRLEEAAAQELDGPETIVEPRHVRIRLADGSLLEARDLGNGTYTAALSGGATRTADDLVHPYLAPIAALVHRWRGVPALHGAAVGGPDGAVGLIGDRARGKTTTAAALVQERGLTLLSDDLIVVDHGEVLPGPLSLDMRLEGADILDGTGTLVRGGERSRRLAAPLQDDSKVSLTLKLCVHLEWGERTRVRPLPASQRLQALSPQLYWPGVGTPATDLLALVALPQVVLERPPGRAGLTEALDAIAELMR